MRAIIQRVKTASVTINSEKVSHIEQGLLILLGIETTDNEEDIQWLVRKIIQMRIFNDEKGVPNLSIEEIAGELLVVSQFTLYASTKKGNRPSYIRAARPETAIPLYELFLSALQKLSTKQVAAGVFGADMQVSLINDGPITLLIDSKNRE
jgi:D-tyrosyl-tRNA(Tyr) deacylase